MRLITPPLVIRSVKSQNPENNGVIRSVKLPTGLPSAFHALSYSHAPP